MQPQYRVQVHSPAPDAAVATIDAGLGEHNAQSEHLAEVQSLHIVVENAEGVVIGGAIGRTWGECCELLQLWVSSTERGAGIGSGIMDIFETEAARRGGSLMYLETFSFQAPDFYRARGYEEVLRTSGFTGGISKFTMHKAIPPAPGPR